MLSPKPSPSRPDGRSAERHVPAPTVTHVERLEYRMPAASATAPGLQEDVPFGAPPLSGAQPIMAGAQPLMADWFGSSSSESSVQDVTPADAAKIAEEQWREERQQLELHLAEQSAAANRAILAAREEGRREASQAAETQFAQEREDLRQQMVESLEAFRQQRERYFHSVEREVVRLALAISARVLHRQAQIDPLFLAGAVRVALEKLADTTGVVLRVAPAQVLAWQEMFRLQGGARMQPEILGDLSLNAGECVLETRLGTVELGVKAQLEEIEKGFFDLLHHHPSPNRADHGLGA